MKAPPIDEADALLEDWDRLFPAGLSDEAAAALLHFVDALGSLLESRYGAQARAHRIRSAESHPPF
ncbi:hypothetical protein [Acidithiobacillus caldus]|jgi:hypothetical protein|uniref:Uncharacterized protein n=1 Tax=Acidithiobacillus caldus (strain ATCC 51756 / DSM 8584 / KU) TaxID=637389 RepID=A0A059ZQU4_ACICK|nr:hypothetical protein [Acidithiobacillus caldus]AIA54065.1 hypothetical protein Acaty_c0174 [Acidithiobacillus caldus ATCC 51756]MBU2731210.1 hypothetical protein [Acidithiobacillus caldus]MBU2736350.1 hypothetical protein [Acidithiobacillus caldus ATCC 51756]MBU2744842.1 hypothetical protein [Acidithiobacillus caldus]MBU2763998.1 hypothetical protein [Acidithiobacillus caldus]